MSSSESSSLPSRKRASRAVDVATVIATSLAMTVSLVACSGTPSPSPSPDGIRPAFQSDAAPTPSAAAPLPLPDAEVVALADRMHLTQEGRTVFYSTQPRLAGAEEIETACAGAGDSGATDGFTGGCFTGTSRDRTADRIFVFRPGDERLRDSMVVVAAHELLHAVYARLEPVERARVDALVAEATARLPGDDPVHEQIEWSVADREANRANEQFAYLGSQIVLEGGFPAVLEDVYDRYFTDRLALVATHQRALDVIDDALAAADAAWADVAARESENARARAQLDADRRGYDSALASYSADLERYNATPPEERERWQVTLRPVAAEPVTMTWAASLDYRREELEGFRIDLEERAAALTAAEAAAADLRASAERAREDAVTLVRAANPNAVISD